MVALFAPALFSGGTLWVWDVSLNFLPNYLHQIQRFQAGDFPEWTSRILGGFPYAADPVQAVFFPLKLVFLLPVDPGWLANAYVALVYLVSGLGMLRLARLAGLSESAAVLSALCWTGSGALASESFLTNWLMARAFVPWLLSEFIRTGPSVFSGDRWGAVRAVFFGAMALFAGEPQTFIIQFGLAFMVLLFADPAASPGKRTVKAIYVTTAIGVPAFLVASVQWFPALDLAVQTPRGVAGMTLEAARECTTHPVRYLEMIFPRFYGTPSEPGSLWPNALFCHPGTKNFYIPSFFIGHIALFLAAFAIWKLRNHRVGAPFVLFALFSLVMSLGERGFLFDLFWEYVPYWNRFRWPERFVPWLTLPLALFAGAGLDLALEPGNRRRAAWLLAGGGVLVALLTVPEKLWITFGEQFSPFHPRVLADTVQRSLEAARWLSVLTVLAGFSLWKLVDGRRAGALVTVLASSALFWNAGALVSFVGGTETVRTEPGAAEIIRSRLKRDGGPVRTEVLPLFRGVKPDPARPPAWSTTVMWHLLFADVPLVSDIDSVRGYNTFLTTRWESTVENQPFPLNTVRLFAADAVVAAPYDPNLAQYGEDGYPMDGGFLVIPVRDPVPRVVCPHSWQMASPDEIRSAIRQPDLDPRKKLFMELVNGQPVMEAGERTSEALICRITHYDHERVMLEIEQTESAPVALLDSYFTGWTARVNGNAVTIYPAWGIHRAIPVPAGRSTVEFTYRTPGLRGAGAVSVMAALAVLFWGHFRVRQYGDSMKTSG